MPTCAGWAAAEQPHGADQGDDKSRAGQEKSAARAPSQSCNAPQITTARPHQSGFGSMARISSRRCQTMNAGDDRHEKAVAHVRIVVPLPNQRAKDRDVTSDRRAPNHAIGIHGHWVLRGVSTAGVMIWKPGLSI